jgi:protein-S-isoprenylcysteine O-methyltransferase Ste14
MPGRVWQWGDVAFYLTVLVVAVWQRPHTRTLAVALIIAGVAFPLWIVARRQLGSAFSFSVQARYLVTTGLYSRFRHPVYLFGSIAVIASVLALQVWWLLVLTIVAQPITVVRAIREERALEAAFGEEYARYRKRTWF